MIGHGIPEKQSFMLLGNDFSHQAVEADPGGGCGVYWFIPLFYDFPFYFKE